MAHPLPRIVGARSELSVQSTCCPGRSYARPHGTHVRRSGHRRRRGHLKQGLLTTGFLAAATFVVLQVRGPQGAVTEVAAAGVAVAAPEVSFQFGSDKSV